MGRVHTEANCSDCKYEDGRAGGLGGYEQGFEWGAENARSAQRPSSPDSFSVSHHLWHPQHPDMSLFISVKKICSDFFAVPYSMA